MRFIACLWTRLFFTQMVLLSLCIEEPAVHWGPREITILLLHFTFVLKWLVSLRSSLLCLDELEINYTWKDKKITEMYSTIIIIIMLTITINHNHNQKTKQKKNTKYIEIHFKIHNLLGCYPCQEVFTSFCKGGVRIVCRLFFIFLKLF